MALFFSNMDKFKKEAIRLNACKEGLDRWNSKDLVGMYRQGVTWCMENKYPSFKDMQPYDDMLFNSRIYNLKEVDLDVDFDTYIMNGCNGKVRIGGYEVSRIYVGRDSVLDIDVSDNSYLIVDCYDKSVVRLNVSPSAKCVIWQYGESSVQLLNGNAKITKK